MIATYDLVVAYRIYPGLSKVASCVPFSNNKLHLSELCLRSFKESLGGLRVRVLALLDGCGPEYAILFRKYFRAEDLVLLTLDGAGNRATFGKQIDLLVAQNESEFVYFAEDDYFYLPGKFPLMIEFLRAYQDVHFVSPYDHPDCYMLDIHRHPKWLRVHGGHHWRTAASTCLTFLTRGKTLRDVVEVFRSYCRGNNDCSLWLSLTKQSVFWPIQFLRFARRQPLFARIIGSSWLYCWRQILLGYRLQLWVPLPGIATHVVEGLLSPAIDWPALMRAEANGTAFPLTAHKGNAGYS